MTIKSEQSVICRYETESQELIEIQMKVRVERPAEQLGDVHIHLGYEQTFPDEVEDLLRPRLFNGVHAGYAGSGVPYLPNTILFVTILELMVTPVPQSVMNIENGMNLGFILEALVCGIVGSSIRSLENIRSGAESYYMDSGPPEEDDEAPPELD